MLVTTPEIWPLKAQKIMIEKGIDMEFLRKQYQEIWFPQDLGYNGERTYFSLRIEQRPLFIVRPHDTLEVENTLNYVWEKHLSIRIMNGRHSSALVSSEVLVDMSYFTDKALYYGDNNQEILVAGAGNTQGALNEFLFEQNKREIYSHFGHFIHPRVDTEAFPGGSAASVGACGITSMGGIGTLVRTYGITVDKMLSYKITLPPNSTSTAQTIIASNKENSDLFWALRGGSANNFGIVSEIQLNILEVPFVVTYKIIWPWNQAEGVLKKYSQTAEFRPSSFNEDLTIYYNDDTGIELDGIYVTDDLKNVKQLIQNELASLVEEFHGELVINKPIKYSDLYRQKVRDRVYFNFSVIQPIFTDNMHPCKAINLIDSAKKERLTGPVSITFTLLGGEMDKVSRKATSFYPRHKKFFVDIASFWNNIHSSTSLENWTEKAVKIYLSKHSYVYVGFPLTFNFLDAEKSMPPAEIYYGKNTKRLRKAKAKYDPLNILTSTGTIF